MLDSDLAELYEIDTGNLNKAVKRNRMRFPEDFCFQLTDHEYENLIFQNGISRWGGTRKLPYVFTEHGVTALSGILKSNIAIEINVRVIRAFVAMRRFISKNADIFHRMDNVERKQIEFQVKTEKNLDKIFQVIESRDIKPSRGIFFDGQVYDAHIFVSDLIKIAAESIVLVDNYIDDSVLTLLSNKKRSVRAKIYTANVSEGLLLAKDKFNKQYGLLEIYNFNLSHDRFLIIDSKEVYHIGASLKDLGKKWFAFSKLDTRALSILEKLRL